ASIALYTALCLYLLIVSGSRTTMIGIAVSAGVSLLLQRRFFAFVCLAALATRFESAIEVLQAQFPILSRTLQRFLDLTSGIASGDTEALDSLQGRQSSWQMAWEYFLQRP